MRGSKKTVGGEPISPDLFLPKSRILVSACLVGWRCRYDGADKLDESLLASAKKYGWTLVPVCPEVLGGLSVPRHPATIMLGDGFDVIDGNAKVATSSGVDVTKRFVIGARLTLDVARKTGCKYAILKEFSPSCGVSRLRNSDAVERKGMGVASAMLYRQGIIIISRT